MAQGMQEIADFSPKNPEKENVLKIKTQGAK